MYTGRFDQVSHLFDSSKPKTLKISSVLSSHCWMTKSKIASGKWRTGSSRTRARGSWPRASLHFSAKSCRTNRCPVKPGSPWCGFLLSEPVKTTLFSSFTWIAKTTSSWTTRNKSTVFQFWNKKLCLYWYVISLDEIVMNLPFKYITVC